MKYFSMFTGIGGFELGLEGHECIGFSEIDKYCSLLLSNKYPEVKNYGDATKINPDELPDFDMLVGGFPCQAFSIAGRREGFNDTRGTLFFEISRIIKTKRPKIVFLENVKGLLNHNKGETFRVIIQTLSELGYDVQWMVFNSKFFGVPQNRERVFIIGSLRGTSRPEILPFTENAGEVSDISKIKRLDDQTNKKRDNEEYRVYDSNGLGPCLKKDGANEIKINVPMVSSASPLEMGFKETCGALRARDYKDPKVVIQSHSPRTNDPKKGGSGLLESSEHCFTIDRTPHTVNKLRRLTPRECERLQGFPDDWTAGFSDTQRYKMCGNAVTVNVIKRIGEKL